MKFLLVAVYFVSVFYCASAGTWFKVLCKHGSPNEIHVRMDKDFVSDLVNKYESYQKNIYSFGTHLINEFTIMYKKDDSCIGGGITREDYMQARNMFTAGIQEFLLQAYILATDRRYTCMWLNTRRGESYVEGVFSLASDDW